MISEKLAQSEDLFFLWIKFEDFSVTGEQANMYSGIHGDFSKSMNHVFHLFLTRQKSQVHEILVLGKLRSRLGRWPIFEIATFMGGVTYVYMRTWVVNGKIIFSNYSVTRLHT